MKTLLYKIFESIFIHLLKKGIDKSLDKEETQKIENKSEIKKTEPKEIKLELTSTSQNLKLAVDLLFNNNYSNKCSLNRVAETLGLKNETEFQNMLNGISEPSFPLLNLFSENYGVDKNWLKYRENTPFKVGISQLYATGYLKIIKQLNPKKIYLVREDSNTARTGIVLMLDTWNYQILGKSYHISSEVGGTGQNQIEEFYYFFKKINSLNCNYSTQSKIVSKEVYSKLFSGHLSPKVLDSFNYDDIKNSYWADDFLDFKHNDEKAKYYELWYGAEFLKAQKILKYKLEA